MKTLKKTLLALLTLAAAACGAPGPDEKACVRSTLEGDLKLIGALSGPDVDPATGALKPGSYLVSSTYLKLATDAKGQKAFQDSMKGINAAIPNYPGLSAYQLATSDSCVTARTLSVWKDEASMYRFVGVEAHANAIALIELISRGGSVVTHWADTEAGATFEKAVQQLAVEVGPFF
jgi:hypothetical protein